MTNRSARLKAASRAYERWVRERTEEVPPGGEFHLEEADDSRYFEILSEELDELQVQAHLPGQHDQKSHGNRGGGSRETVQNYLMDPRIGSEAREQISVGMGLIQEKFGVDSTADVFVQVAPQGRPGAFAWVPEKMYETTQESIELSPWYLGLVGRTGSEEMAEVFPELRETGHFVQVPADVGNWEYTIIHEMGHVMDTRHGLQRELFGSQDAVPLPISRGPNPISRYGVRNLDEFIAESFVDFVYNGDNAREHSRVLGNAILAAGAWESF